MINLPPIDLLTSMDFLPSTTVIVIGISARLVSIGVSLDKMNDAFNRLFEIEISGFPNLKAFSDSIKTSGLMSGCFDFTLIRIEFLLASRLRILNPGQVVFVGTRFLNEYIDAA